jgi:hypothetical protein
MTASTWWLAVAVVTLAAGGYRYSLWRHPTRKCHSCGGAGKHSGALFSYASGPCRGRTLIPPRVPCKGGRVDRWGLRLINQAKGK